MGPEPTERRRNTSGAFGGVSLGHSRNSPRSIRRFFGDFLNHSGFSAPPRNDLERGLSCGRRTEEAARTWVLELQIDRRGWRSVLGASSSVQTPCAG